MGGAPRQEKAPDEGVNVRKNPKKINASIDEVIPDEGGVSVKLKAPKSILKGGTGRMLSAESKENEEDLGSKKPDKEMIANHQMDMHVKTFPPAKQHLHTGTARFLRKKVAHAYSSYLMAAGLLMMPSRKGPDILDTEVLELADEALLEATMILEKHYFTSSADSTGSKDSKDIEGGGKMKTAGSIAAFASLKSLQILMQERNKKKSNVLSVSDQDKAKNKNKDKDEKKDMGKDKDKDKNKDKGKDKNKENDSDSDHDSLADIDESSLLRAQEEIELLADIVSNIGTCNLMLKKNCLALQYYGKAMALRELLEGMESQGSADTLQNMATCFEGLKRYHEAEGCLLKALSIEIEDGAVGAIPPPPPLSAPTPQSGVSGVSGVKPSTDIDTGKGKDKDKGTGTGTGTDTDNTGKGTAKCDPNTIALTRQNTSLISNLGIVYTRLGRFEEGEALVAKVVDFREKFLGKEHDLTLNAASNLHSIRAYLKR